MTETEVRRLVRREVDSICKREGGALPPTPYVVVEVIERLRTLKPWEGLGTTDSISRALRKLVEEQVVGVPRFRDTPQEPAGEEDLRDLHPREQLKRVGAPRHRHVLEIPLKEAV